MSPLQCQEQADTVDEQVDHLRGRCFLGHCRARPGSGKRPSSTQPRNLPSTTSNWSRRTCFQMAGPDAVRFTEWEMRMRGVRQSREDSS
ncbi:hypothetical protein CAG99_21150 [Streptomyces marincola]|uniref:Uncharacterized protein n=1 Tax=Streptomyces marincola TaxID=2878388 RepID=A0A1W7D1Q1_9ACTN|nr:hypothetical protein CAG99_21150 [Streptomyces marincola]